MTNIDDAILAVSDPVRRGIVELLATTQLRTNDIAKALEMSVPAVSRHLRVLRQTGAVHRLDVESDGRGRRYELTQETFRVLDRWVADNLWSSTLGALDVDDDSQRLLTRVGGFLDSFASGNRHFFETHLADDAYAIFPGSSKVWDAEAILQTVDDHPPYTSWNVHNATTTPLAPNLTLLSVQVDVQTEAAMSPSTVHQTMIFDDRSDPWKLRFLQQTPSTKGTQP